MFASRRHATAIAITLFAAVALSTQLLGPARGDNVAGGEFVPLTPVRIVDTVNGTGGSNVRLGPGQYRDYQVTGVGGVPLSGVSSVVVDLSATSVINATSSSLRVYAADATVAPDTSQLRIEDGTTQRSNTLISRVSAAGKIRVLNGSGNVHFNLDIQGFFTTVDEGSGFHPLPTPVRMVSTSYGTGVPIGNIPANATYDIQIAGSSGIPTNATAVFANAKTYTSATTGGALRIGEGGVDSTAPASMEYGSTGRYADSGMSIPLSPDGTIRVSNLSSSTTVSLWIDVQGYFLQGTESRGGFFTALAGQRVVDSTIASAETRTVTIAGLGGLPSASEIGAVALSVLAQNWATSGAITIYPADSAAPAQGASSLSFSNMSDAAAGLTSTTLVGTSASGAIKIKNSSSQPVRVILSAQGWFGVSEIDPDPVPALKAAELADPGPNVDLPQLSLSEEIPATTVSGPSMNGPTNDVDSVKASAAAALTAQLKVGAMPPTIAEREATAASRESYLQTVASQIWHPSVALQQTQDLLSIVREAAADPTYPSYTDARFVIGSWVKVSVTGDSATITVNGKDQYLSSDAEWVDGPPSQYQMTFIRSSDPAVEWQVSGQELILTAPN